MRRLILVLLVGGATMMAPNWGLAGNQQVAEQIAANLRESGLLHGYQISVKYQDGVASLNGRVHSEEQRQTALNLVYQTAGVIRVDDDLEIGQDESATKPLQQSTGAIAPENRRLPVTSGFGTPGTQPMSAGSLASTPPKPVMPPQIAATEEKPAPLQQPADKSQPDAALRLATSFTPSPAIPVAATTPPPAPIAAPTPSPVAPESTVQHAAPVVTRQQPAQVPTLTATPRPMPVARPMAEVAMMPTQAQPVPTGHAAMTTYTQGAPLPMNQLPAGPAGYASPVSQGPAMATYDQPNLPCYAWPSYAAHPNYAAVCYPKKHAVHAWPYIGPHYPYPQVPMGWRKVTLEWHDGYWNLDFDDGCTKTPFSGLFRPWK